MTDSEDEQKKKEREKREEQKKKEEAERIFKEKNIDNIPKIIAAICPVYYAKGGKKAIDKIEKLKKQNKFWEAVSIAEEKDADAGEKFYLSYNSSAESLEPVYFWILDFLGGEGKVDKLIDNFVSSPGSGHFSELMGKATRMQEEAMKVMQTIGVLIKSIIPIIYDLRQFEMRFKDYDAADSEDKSKKEAGLLALKQVWMDNVDIKRGNSSIKAMTFSQQGSFITLLNAFMKVNSLEEVENEDLNDIVKRVLKQRVLEFFDWKKLSEAELRKRYSIQKAWLRSQVESLKLYSRWAKPYLKAAEELRMSSSLSASSALVKAFNTNLMQLVLLKKDKIGKAEIQDFVYGKSLPANFINLSEKGKIRNYNSCVFVDLRFRGIPTRVDQHYGFGGKSDVTFRAYSLRDDEIEELKKRLEESDLKDALKLVENATQESLKEIEEDIRYFLEDEDKREEIKHKEKEEQNINPFTALIGKGTFWSKEEKKKESDLGKPENYAEKVVRNLSIFNAKKGCFSVYDIYKKGHGMASIPIDDQWEISGVKVGFKELFKK